MIHKSLFLRSLPMMSAVGDMRVRGCHSHFSHGCGFHGSHEKKAEWILKKVSKTLDISKEQKKKLALIMDEVKAKHQDQVTSHNAMFDAFLEQVRSDQIDEEDLSKRLDEQHAKMDQMRPFVVSKIKEFHAMLTPEQREKLAEKMAEYHRKWHH